jgi:hypothetical protein
MTTFRKDPDAVLDYKVDWTAWLGDDTLTSSTFTASSDAITLTSESNDSTSATVWISGGVLNGRYKVTNHITTSEGRVEDRTFTVLMVQR